MATNLFAMPNTSTLGKTLLEFKAGKMNLEGKQLVPDKRKGMVQLVQTPDSLMHFIWKDRTTGTNEDDLIIFPEEAVFKKVKQTPGRVYVLEFKSTSRRLFFWMQHTKTDDDAELSSKLTQYINNPPESEQGQASLGIPENIMQFSQLSRTETPAASTSSTAVQVTNQREEARAINQGKAPNNMEMEAPAPMINQPTTQTEGSMSITQAPSSTVQPNVPTASTSSVGAVQLNQLQNILSSFGVSVEGKQKDIDLEDVISAEKLFSTLSDPEVQKQLLPLLPEEQRYPEELLVSLHSPQVQQALDVFSRAIRSGELGDMMRELGINTFVASVEQFLNGLQEASNRSKDEQNAKKQKTDG